MLLLEVRKDEPGREINPRVSMYRCKKCNTPNEGEDRPKFLTWAMSSYVLNMYSERSPPFHLTAEDVSMELDHYRIQPTHITKHRISRGLGGKNAVQYFTSWDEVTVKTWEHETDLDQYGSLVSRYWAGDPVQVGGENAKYGRYRVQLAKRTLACANGERYVATGYKVCCDTRGRPGIYDRDIIGSYMYFKTSHAGWQLARVGMMVAEDSESKELPHTIKLLDLGKRYNIHPSEKKLTTVSGEVGI